ncbi:hypothetical protein R1flu_028279 [Riccia fluitans]|uniref:Uncharacterized protein n=1 Tax=Riccia fluitans TaxID=41844 RepID=A0ABD1XP33_9MARC
MTVEAGKAQVDMIAGKKLFELLRSCSARSDGGRSEDHSIDRSSVPAIIDAVNLQANKNFDRLQSLRSRPRWTSRTIFSLFFWRQFEFRRADLRRIEAASQED